MGFFLAAYGLLISLAAAQGRLALASALGLLYLCFVLVERKLIDKTSTGLDLPYLGNTVNKPRLRGRAVIAGGSVSGLIAARILTDHYEEVLIVDDEMQDESASKVRRVRVEQHQRLHGLSWLVYEVTKKLFPEENIDEEVHKVGGCLSKSATTPRISLAGGALTYAGCPATSITLTRPTFEALYRKLVFRHCKERVKLVYGRVTALSMDQHRPDRIKSLTVTPLSGEPYELDATLVVDATGASSAGQKWLRRLGYAQPKTLVYSPVLRYNEANFYLSDEEWAECPAPTNGLAKEDLGMVATAQNPPNNAEGIAGALVCRYENNRITVAYGHRGDNAHLPTTPDEFYEVCAKTDIGDYAMSLLKYLTKCEKWDCRTAFINHCSRTCYDELERLPHNFIAIGDSITRLNPVFGQGITQASRNVIGLDRMLQKIRSCTQTEVPEGFSLAFFKKTLKRNDTMINGNIMNDAQWDSFEPYQGQERPKSGFAAKLMVALIKAGHSDPYCADLFSRLVNGFTSPLALLNIETLARIAWARYATVK